MTITSDDDELKKLLAEADRRAGRESRIFFVRHFLRTFDPRPEAFPHDLDFDLYDFQVELIEELYQAITEGFDEFIEKSRDMGVSWVALALIFWCWLYLPGFQALVGSRKEDYVDNGEIDSLFGKIDYFLEKNKDPLILPKGFKKDKHRTYMKLSNPENGNSIIGESSNKNFSRAGRYSVVLFDEFGFWPDAKRSWTSASQSTRCRIAVTTPPDEPSYAKTVRFSEKVRVTTLHWRLHPDKDDVWYANEKSRLLPEELLHEVDISWEYSAAGRPYPEADTIPIGDYPYNPLLPVYCSIDLGLDAVAIQWRQPVPNTDWWNIVEAFEKSDEIIDWFFPIFGAPIESSKYTYTDDELKLIEKVKYWHKNCVYFGDPSGKQRHIESKESAYTKLRGVGVIVMSNDKENDFKSRRDATKRLLPKTQANNTPGVLWAIECLKLAHYPKRSEESQSTSPIVKPVHDFTSHHRTSTEFFSVNYKNYHNLPMQQLGGAGRPRRYDPETGRLLS